jgi:hypothetical protein
MTMIAPASLSLRPVNRQASRPVADTLRFSGDAFEIRKKLITAQQVEVKQVKSKQEEERNAEFKAIGDVVVWQQGADQLTVADMVAYLCRIRPEDGYPGYGTPEDVAKDFPGMNVEALKQGFQSLHEAPVCYLGKDKNYGKYWLRPEGKRMISQVYPEITLPPVQDLLTFIKLSTVKYEK